MADSEELVISNSTSSPDFIQDLLPSADRTALLYHLSYLCLGKFPKLERLIRERAVETQLLFGSSEAVLMKCALTSENLVESLLPSLKVTAEKNKPELARQLLEKAKEWIGDIISDVKEIVTKYQKHNGDVAKSTSDIIAVKDETEKQQLQQTYEMEEIQKIVDSLEEKLHSINKKIEDSEKKLEKKNAEIQKFINSITNTKEEETTQTPAVMSTMGSKVALFSMIVPFVENIIHYIWKMVRATSDEDVIRSLHTALSELIRAQKSLKDEEWDIQNKLMDKQLHLAKLKIENGQMPSVTHLDEVQMCLSRIQQILVQLQKFWEKVGSHLDKLKKKTFTGEIWINDFADLKKEFLESIDAAKEGWVQFGKGCTEANNIFSIKSSMAYRFLEISPSSLSKEHWEKEYDNVKEKLEKIRSNTVNRKAITQ